MSMELERKRVQKEILTLLRERPVQVDDRRTLAIEQACQIISSLLEAVEKGNDEAVGDKIEEFDSKLFFCRELFSVGNLLDLAYSVFSFYYFCQKRRIRIFDYLSITSQRASEKQGEAWIWFFENVKPGDDARIFFGTELFQNVLDVSKCSVALETTKMDPELLISLIRFLLYHCYSGEKICEALFAFVAIIPEKHYEELKDVAEKEILYNYQKTCEKVAKKYLLSENKLQKNLAETIVRRCEEKRHKRQAVPNNVNLCESSERRQVYRTAWLEQNARINTMAHNKSVFSMLISKETLKYGKKVGFISNGVQRGYNYRVSAMDTFEIQHELPLLYVISPLDWTVKSNEVKKDWSK